VARPLSKFAWLAHVQGQPAEILDWRARAVAAALVMHADRDALTVAVSLESLASRTGLSRSTVLRGLQVLHADSWLGIRRGGGGHPGQSRRVTSTYRFTIPAWGRRTPQSGYPTDTQTPQSGYPTDTQTQPPTRQSGCPTDTPLRRRTKKGDEPAAQTTTHPADEPISGQAIRDILTRRNQSQPVTRTAP
jgi:DNA-binding transcriptional MocR family regulator